MDPRLLNYYNRELQFIRESGAEFAQTYPKIASRLGIDEFDCADPYVERLFEGFALLAARIQLKLDSEFPRFTQHLLEMVYPHYLAPQPAMTVVQMQPDLTEGALGEGFTLPRHTVLHSLIGKGEQTRCTFRTAHDVTLWPIQLLEANYYPRDVAALSLPDTPSVKAALILKFQSTAGLEFQELPIDRLPLFVQGTSDVPMRIYEQLLSSAVGIAIRDARSPQWKVQMGSSKVRPVGFSDDESMLPYRNRSFSGYRLLQEYFAFPHRFMFAELSELRNGMSQCEGDTIEIAVLFSRGDSQLSNRVDQSHFELFCTPAINLFEKRTDRIHLSDRYHEHQIIPDRTRPLDFEVFEVTEVKGYGDVNDREQEFRPFYSIDDFSADIRERAFYTLSRRQRLMSSSERQYGPRSSYIGSETYLSLVDGDEAPYSRQLQQLSINTLCTNRDLPIQMPVGIGETDFSLELSAPVESTRCLVGPSKPLPSKSYHSGQISWRLISHLSLNYLSLVNGESGSASALRELLSLYSDSANATANKQIDAVRTIESRPVTRPIQSEGPLSFGRGLELTITLDESGFEGTGAFLLAAVLREFFAKYVSVNSFTETVFRTTERGEVSRWPAMMGRRHTL